MSKKRTIIILVFITLCIALIIFSYTDFFNDNSEDSVEILPIEQEGGYEEISKYLLDENIFADNSNNSDFTGEYLKKITYKIEEYKKIDDEKGKATITVFVPDLEFIVREAINETISQSTDDTPYNELLNISKEKIAEKISKDFEIKTTTMEIDIKKFNNEWKIIPNDEWEYATKGYVLDVLLKNFRKLIEE